MFVGIIRRGAGCVKVQRVFVLQKQITKQCAIVEKKREEGRIEMGE